MNTFVTIDPTNGLRLENYVECASECRSTAPNVNVGNALAMLDSFYSLCSGRTVVCESRWSSVQPSGRADFCKMDLSTTSKFTKGCQDDVVVKRCLPADAEYDTWVDSRFLWSARRLKD